MPRSSLRADARRQPRPRAVLLVVAAVLAVWAPGASTAWIVGAAGHVRRSPALVARRAEQSDEERLEFMNSPVGQAIGFLAKALADSPLNDGKIWFAKVQAGEYDPAPVQAKLDSYIKDNAVVMFSFS